MSAYASISYRVIELMVLLILSMLISGVAGAAGYEQSAAGAFGVLKSEDPDFTKTLANGGPATLSSKDCDIEINFDEATVPSSFNETTRLTELYSGLGLHFEGPGGSDGGAVIAASTWPVTDYSPPNLLGFDSSASLSDGGDPTGPETIRFDNPAVFFEAAFGSGPGGTLQLKAFDAADNMVDQAGITLTSSLQRVRVMGRNIVRVEFDCDAPQWVVDDICIITEVRSGVLYLFDSCGGSSDFAGPALSNLGYADVHVTKQWNDYEFAIRTGQWDLVIVENYESTLPDAVLDALLHYHASGGRIIFASASLYFHRAHPFLGDMGVSALSYCPAPPPVYSWNTTSLFDEPNAIPDLATLIDYCVVDAARLAVTTAVAAAGYTATIQAGEAAVAVSENGRIITNAFMPGTVSQDTDSDGKNDMIELYENEIFLLTGAGDASLTATPSPLEIRVPAGGTQTVQVTLENRSDVPIDWTSGTADVLFVCASFPGNFLTELRREPGIGQVDYLDARVATPDLAELQQYDAVIVTSHYYFLDSTALGDVLADYVDAGGKVIHASSSSFSGWQITGRFLEEGYATFAVDNTEDFEIRNLGEYDAGHPIMEGISTLRNFYGFPSPLTSGSVLVAQWDNGAPLLATRGDSVVGINLLVPGPKPGYGGDVARLFRNAVLWLRGESLLAVNPVSGALPPGATAVVDIAADAAGLPLGSSRMLSLGFHGTKGGAAVMPVSVNVVPACLEGAFVSQKPYIPEESDWGMAASSDDMGYKCYENFWGLTEPVAALRWWGVDGFYSTGWHECERAAWSNFSVGFYADGFGGPAELVREFTVKPTVTDTGLRTRDSLLTVNEYEVVLPEKVRMNRGWVSIEGVGGDSCSFLWITSPEGDGAGLQYLDGWPFRDRGDLSLCIVTDPECTSMADIFHVSTLPGTTAGGPAYNDTYGCAGEVAWGPEAVYRYVAPADGTVEVSLSDITVDLNLYLLEGQCIPALCSAFGDDFLTFTAVAGTEYFVVVDGTDAAGGEFVLNIEVPVVEGEGEPLVEGEGEPPVEGEGEPPVEGEDEPPVEGEGEPPVEGEGESPVEGEGEPPVEGEGEPLVEGEGEPPVEGEGEPPVEGEGEPPVEGEGEPPVEGEGEPPVEGEGEPPVEGETLLEGEFEGESPAEGEGESEQPPDGCGARGCQGCDPKTDPVKRFQRFLGDYLLAAITLLALALAAARIPKP